MPSNSDLAASLATAARSIDHEVGLAATLGAIVEAARRSVPGMDHVGISTTTRSSRIETRAGTGELVTVLDDLQYSLGEGPCVDALGSIAIVSVPHIRHEQRWPRYVAEAVRRTGLTAQLAVRLFLDEEGTMGTLNFYSTSRSDIDAEAENVADLFAAHAAIALGRAREISGLQDALLSRKTIGQALGIVMERYQMSEDRAFAFLTRASSHGNVKLRDVAQEVVFATEEQTTRRGA